MRFLHKNVFYIGFTLALKLLIKSHNSKVYNFKLKVLIAFSTTFITKNKFLIDFQTLTKTKKKK